MTNSQTIDRAIEAMIIVPQRKYNGRQLRELVRCCNSSFNDKDLTACVTELKRDKRIKCNTSIKNRPVYSYKGIA